MTVAVPTTDAAGQWAGFASSTAATHAASAIASLEIAAGWYWPKLT